jgi:hypothetical protein
MSQMDVYTINNDLSKPRRYIEIVRQAVEDHWKG